MDHSAHSRYCADDLCSHTHQSFQTQKTISAFALPVEKEGKQRMQDSWAVHEVMNTANFAPRSRIFSWFIGGLNYQIEHHLFTGVCHVHYKKIAAIVKSTVEEFGLPYHVQPTFLQALWVHAKMLKKLGRDGSSAVLN